MSISDIILDLICGFALFNLSIDIVNSVMRYSENKKSRKNERSDI